MAKMLRNAPRGDGPPGQLMVDGRLWRYLLVEPSGPAVGIVLSLHGSGSSAERQRRLSGMDALPAQGALVAYPEAGVRQGLGWRWDQESDLPFIVGLIEMLLRAHPQATSSVVLAGMSGGARMACHVAARRPDLVGAVGAVAGLRAPSPPPTHPVRVIAFHGTADRVNPYAGGGRPDWRESVPAAAEAWAAANGAGPEPQVTAPSPRLLRTSYGTGSAEVVLWTLAGGGHTWPGGHLGLLGRLFLGGTSREIDASEAIWRFAMDRAHEP
ncbi:MAG: alpha/beta hydrolase family esterase [Candidatus Limnocylindrales bacterium]